MRFGLIGTGLMGQEHLRNLLLMPDAEIVALADPAASSLDWSRQTLGPKASGVACFTEPARMLREADLDAVVVASPNHTHRAVLEPLWQTGLHILCEKPMATTIEDARAIAARAGSHRGIFWVGMEYRWMPPVTAFIDDVARGRAGRLHRLAMQEHRSPFLAKVGDWNRFNRNTGGTMVEKCCHFFDLMRLIVASEPVRVFCSAGADVNHRAELYDGRVPDIADNAFAVVDFDNGVRAMLDLCMFAEGAEEQEELVATGELARLKVSIPSGIVEYAPRCEPGTPKRVERRHVAVSAEILAAGHHHGATYYQTRAFIDAARGSGPVAVTGEDGLRAVAIGLAAERSAAEHRVVPMSEFIG